MKPKTTFKVSTLNNDYCILQNTPNNMGFGAICLLLLCFWFKSPDMSGNICGDAYVPALSW